jgi:hypothetical protein
VGTKKKKATLAKKATRQGIRAVLLTSSGGTRPSTHPGGARWWRLAGRRRRMGKCSAQMHAKMVKESACVLYTYMQNLSVVTEDFLYI